MSGAFAFALVLPSALAAQTVDEPTATPAEPATVDGKRVFLPADFTRFAPRTAYEMLVQVPGFAPRSSEERRGLGQASENVVINGKRVAGKTNDALSELGRIPASRVVRIELVDGATLDVPGLSGQVANVIVAAGGGKTSFEWAPVWRPKIGEFRPFGGSLTTSGARGALSYTLGVENVTAVSGGIGPEFVYDRNGRLIDTRDEIGYYHGHQPRASASLKWQAPGGGIANLNAQYQQTRLDNFETSLRSGAGQPDRDRRFRARERSWLYEVGGDYEHPLGGGRLKLIGLRREEHVPSLSSVVTAIVGAPAEGVRYDTVADTAETIGRAEYRWKAGVADWQLSIEGAFNRLNQATAYATLAPDGSYVPVDLADATATVSERRGEAIATYGRPLGATVTVQASAGAEISEISQSGPRGLRRRFVRPKGSLTVAWKASPRLDVTAKIERAVGQLAFSSFLASINVIAGGIANAGNPDLVPQQSWDGELQATRSLGALGSINARVYRRQIQDIVDQVPIGATGESPGNIPSATIHGIDVSSTFKLDPLGWRGARFDLRAQLQDSKVADPLTAIDRRISVSLRRLIDVRFRHDLPGSDWAWGAAFSERINYDNYRLGEISNLYNPATSEAFVEHKDVAGLRARLTFANVLGINETYRRAVYTPRRTGSFAYIERRSRGYGPEFRFTLSGEI